jgi:hypothetical protein
LYYIMYGYKDVIKFVVQVYQISPQSVTFDILSTDVLKEIIIYLYDFCHRVHFSLGSRWKMCVKCETAAKKMSEKKKKKRFISLKHRVRL